MGFFDLFLPSKDPAHDWEAMPGLPLECDLDEPSLNGVRLGDAAEVLSRFGPPENRRPTRDGRYDHPSRGFEIDTTGGRIDGLVFYWNAPDPATHFKGTFTWGGRPLKLDTWTEERDVRNAFGEPYWIDNDENENIFFYEFPQKSLEWQVEFRRGRLTVFILVTPSLLSDPVQREGYRVTRPWPPLT